MLEELVELGSEEVEVAACHHCERVVGIDAGFYETLVEDGYVLCFIDLHRCCLIIVAIIIRGLWEEMV